MVTLILAYLFYCIIECPIVNLLNLFQGKIFYDIKHYKPRENELRHQSDINGNSHMRSESQQEVANDADMLSYPPNIVVQEFNSEVKQRPNEFEMSTPSGSSNNNKNIENIEEASTSEIATSKL